MLKQVIQPHHVLKVVFTDQHNQQNFSRICLANLDIFPLKGEDFQNQRIQGDWIAHMENSK